jgi:hypothetical protein
MTRGAARGKIAGVRAETPRGAAVRLRAPGRRAAGGPTDFAPKNYGIQRAVSLVVFALP